MFLAFSGFSLLLPVVPLAVLRAGGSSVLAGATTGVFMTATVAVQTLTPRVLSRWGYRPALVAGAALLGLPSAGLVLAAQAGFDTAGGAAAVLVVCALRGAGFGMMTVAGSALVAELAPPGALGRSTSLIGLSVGVSEAVFLPAGLAALDAVGLDVVAWAATVGGAAGIAAAAALPTVRPSPADPAGGPDAGGAGIAVLRPLVVPFVLMVAVSLSYGAVSTFLSPALERYAGGRGVLVAGIALGVLGAAVVLGRTVSGGVTDRRGPGALAGFGAAACALALAGIGTAVGGESDPWWLLAWCALFGAGFGIVQNEALVASFERVSRAHLGVASASWNISFDAGTGAGSLVLGLAVGHGYGLLFGLATAVTAALGAPAAWALRRAGAARPPG